MNRKFELLFAVSLPLLLYLMVFTGNVYFFYIAMLIGLIFISKPIILLPMYFVSSLSTMYFSLSNGSSVGRYTFFLIFISLIIEISKCNKRNNTSYNTLIILLVVFVFLSALTSVTGNLLPFIQMAMNLLFCGLLIKYNRLDVKLLYKYVSISYFFCLFSVALFIMAHGQDLFMERFQDDEEVMNSNRLAMMCTQAGALLYSMFLLSKKTLSKIFAITGYIIAIIEIVVLGSRSALISLILMSVIGFYIFQKVNKTSKSVSIVFVSLLIIGGGVALFLSSIESQLMTRFTVENVMETKGTGRFDLAKIIVTRILPDNFWFGVGIGSSNIVEAGKSFGLQKPCHNIIIDPLSQLGILGFGLFLLFLVPIFHKSFKASINPNVSSFILPAFLLFLASIINGIGEIVFYEKFFWNDVALCAFCLVAYNKRKIKYGKIQDTRS